MALISNNSSNLIFTTSSAKSTMTQHTSSHGKLTDPMSTSPPGHDRNKTSISSMMTCSDVPSHSATVQHRTTATSDDRPLNQLLSNILHTMPLYPQQQLTSDPMSVPNGNLLGYSNGSYNSSRLSSLSMNDDLGRDFLLSNMLQAMGTADEPSLLHTPSTSPQTSTTSGGSLTSPWAPCGRCDVPASSRCLDCNDVLCDECISVHLQTSFAKEHTVVPIDHASPVDHLGLSKSPQGFFKEVKDPHCDVHNEVLRFYCDACSRIVCQECTLWEHKEHLCIPIMNAIKIAKEKVTQAIDSGKLGKKYIKNSIDKAVAISKSIEREATETSIKIRKAMKHFIMVAEDRERQLLDKVDKIRQHKINELADQMHGLRNALAGLAQTNDMLVKALENGGIDLVLMKNKGETQMEQFAAMYKTLQPKDDNIIFVAPNFDLLPEIKQTGDVLSMGFGAPPLRAAMYSSMRRPIGQPNCFASDVQQPMIYPAPIAQAPSLIGLNNNKAKGAGQCIPGSLNLVAARPPRNTRIPIQSFASDGQEDGQVSRPWGLCVDKNGNIIVADRRNNRVQVFSPDGSFKLKFGSKGTAAGQFDLPAGISTDPQNRIVVVDKDNHRVQMFASNGDFILKFGTYGKDCGQFQYPWDVAINAKGEILITDSRNHRIQLFSSEGVFLTRFNFDGNNHNRALKGLTTPRGVCFTPRGDVIISDFENHRLLLIDSQLTKIIAAKGYEGTAIGEFSRPSGVICDDEGRVIVADSKNQRVLVFSEQLEFLWLVDVRGSSLDEKDRPSDIALTREGNLVVMVETLPDSRDLCVATKNFVQVF